MNAKTVKVNQKKKQPLRLGLDTAMFWIVISLLAFGLLMLYSASWQYSVTIMGKEPSYLFKRQLIFLLLGSAAAIFIFFFDYRKMGKFVILGMILMIIMLVLVIFYVNEVRLGAKRGLFNGSIQPSELAKLMIIVYLAYWLNNHQQYLHKFSFGILPVGVILGIACGLIFLQPDISAAITILMIGGLMFFFAGGEMQHIIIAMVAALAVVAFAVFVIKTGEERISAYLLGLQDPSTASYHLTRSFEAIVKGGIFGAGIGRGNTKFTGLPVAPTDSIFAVIVEETGLIGASVIIILFVLFLWRGFYIAKRAPDTFGQLLASGITVWIFLEAFINMSVLVNLLPFAGNALPFISYGGSNLTMVLTGVGIILSVARQTAIEENLEEGRRLNAVINLRRDDGRRNLPRTRSSSSNSR